MQLLLTASCWMFIHVVKLTRPTDLARAFTYRVAQKIGTIFCTTQLYQILTDFQNYFTVRIRRQFVIILSPKIPPYLNCVATLPYEMSSVLEATIENKTIYVTTNKHTLRNYIKCSMCPPRCWMMHSS